MSEGAILCAFDAGGLAGAPILRGAKNTVIPAVGLMYDGGRYRDVVSFLAGYGAPQNPTTELSTLWAIVSTVGVGTLSAGIDQNDRFYIHSTAVEAFTVTPGASDPWGWGGVVSSTVSGSGRRCTAANAWTRGPLDVTLLVSQMIITAGAGAGLFPQYAAKHHSLPGFLRSGVGDTDDTSTMCMEEWENDTHDNANRRIRWGIDASGHVFCSWASPAISDLAWDANAAATAFRAALGFTGDEVAGSAVGGRKVITAALPCPGVQVIRRGWSRREPKRVNRGEANELLDGTVRGVRISTAVEHVYQFDLRGTLATVDEERHFLRHVSPLLYPGAAVSMYGLWGDPRRARAIGESRTGAAVATTDMSYVGQFGGLEGRRRARIAPGSDEAFSLSYVDGPRSITNQLTIMVREDG